MRIEQVLQKLGLTECIIRAVQQVDKRILEDSKFNVDQYVKKGMSIRIGEEILKKDGLIEENTGLDYFHKSYRAEIFVFTRSEFKKLIEKLTEGR